MITPRPSSTVVLVRDAADGLQVYLMRRHAQMAFAGGAHVFPGGSVDPHDYDEAIGWAGPKPESWGAVMGCSAREARAYVGAAVRETFEETGVLLAGTPNGGGVHPRGAEWEQARAAVEAGELAFSDLLAERGLVLRSDLLRYWSRWVTPPMQPRRFDTRFFVAMLPQGQDARNVSTEADEVSWTNLRDALEMSDRADIRLLRPTLQTCREVAEHPDVEAVLAAASTRTPLEML